MRLDKYLKVARIIKRRTVANEACDTAHVKVNGKNAKAFEAAQKVVELNPEMAGKAYMLIGTIWGSTVCGGNEIERRSPYWVAVDYMTKAKNADPSLEEDANNYIRQYSAYYPEASEAFMYGVEKGQSYTVSCGGMRAVTTVRLQ